VGVKDALEDVGSRGITCAQPASRAVFERTRGRPVDREIENRREEGRGGEGAFSRRSGLDHVLILVGFEAGTTHYLRLKGGEGKEEEKGEGKEGHAELAIRTSAAALQDSGNRVGEEEEREEKREAHRQTRAAAHFIGER